jgi:hypothetical protein
MSIRVFKTPMIAACILLPSATLAQSDDLAYCLRLGALASRYMGSAGADGGLAVDWTTRQAIDDCNAGKIGPGTAFLEKKLRAAGFTLPRS